MRFYKFYRFFSLTLFAGILGSPNFAQEALKSAKEEYYDFLSLTGAAERPTLCYRTLSDSQWKLTDETQNIWSKNNLGKKYTLYESDSKETNWFTAGIDRSIKLRLYGPEWFSSYNTKAPYGQNDGALWQGKGLNTSLTAGARLEACGLELTVKPQLTWSQNKDFDIMPSNTDSEYGYFWGYGKNVGCDAPQRFGDSPFWTFDWGDTEIRWSWHTLTAGFGFQSPWLGPAFKNPVLHSNNAPSYPKFDVGLRKQRVVIPGIKWDLGEIEGRVWTGYLTESDYFDNDEENDHNLIHGFTFSYAPSFFRGLTIGLNRTCLVKSSFENLKYIIPIAENTHVGEVGAGEDQKISVTLDYIFPSVGFEIYGEIGSDDYAPGGGIDGYMRYFTSTTVYTVGAKKSMTLSKEKNIFGELIFEWNNTEMSSNYLMAGSRYSFGFHYQITQGYTNQGQWLGSGIGYGGNSQHLEYRLFYPKGTSSIFIGRNNPDNNYAYTEAANSSAENVNQKYGHSFKANYYFGGITDYFVTPNICVSGGIIFNYIINPLYNIRDENNETGGNARIRNYQIQLGIKYNL